MKPYPSLGWYGSGFRARAAKPFIKADASKARFAQRHQRALLHPATEIKRLRIAHHLLACRQPPFR